MITIKRSAFEKISLINSVEDQLRRLGFVQFEGSMNLSTDYDNYTMGDTVYSCFPTRQDLLTKQFESNYIHPWQKRKAILFRKF